MVTYKDGPMDWFLEDLGVSGLLNMLGHHADKKF